MAKRQKGLSGSKKGKKSAHNTLTGKYERQRVRTEARKAKRRAQAVDGQGPQG